MKELNIIVAMTEQFVIGHENSIPWKSTVDMQRFKQLTTGHPIIMGRKTYESIGRPLPERENIVITRNPELKYDKCHMASTLQEGLDKARELSGKTPFIIGGSEIYAQALPQVTHIYMSVMKFSRKGDAHFPNINPDEWNTVKFENHEDHIFQILARK